MATRHRLVQIPSGDRTIAGTLVAPDTGFIDTMHTMTRKGLGAAVVVEGRRILGIFTDGDLRRLIEGGGELRQLTAREVMHPRPRTVRADALAVEAAELMEQHRITLVLVTDDAGELQGVLSVNDLMRAKVI